MKRSFVLILLLICLCCLSNFSCKPGKIQPLNFYKKYSKYTDPGKYSYLYKNLPNSLNELAELINFQLIHTVDVGPYLNIIHTDTYYEDPLFPTVEKILAGLMKLDWNGLTFDRKPENRLIVTCRNHAILLASILKYQGIPARVRYGFAPYLSKKGFHISHTICEVWNDKEKRWMFVDPYKKMIDFPRNEFELGGDVWLQYQNGKIDNPEKYGIAMTWGAYNILDMLMHDMASVLGQELLYWERPPISNDDDIGKIEKEKVEILNKIALLLKNPDDNLNEIKGIYEKYPFLQFNN